MEYVASKNSITVISLQQGAQPYFYSLFVGEGIVKVFTVCKYWSENLNDVCCVSAGLTG